MTGEIERLRAVASNAAAVTAAAAAVREVWTLDVPPEISHHMETFDPPTVLALLDDLDVARQALHDEREARHIVANYCDRFRDVLAEALGHDENPGDDALIRDLRAHFGKTGPEPTRWRDFCSGALAVMDQINADRRSTPPATTSEEVRDV